ncbi:60S ribosomal protein L13A [Paramecium bursaria]
MFEKVIVIDGKGHLLGRLASYVAKELLRGQRVVIVRTELIQQSGSLFRNRVIFEEYLNKKMAYNPRRGYKHYRTPSRVFWKVVRGMLNYKSPKGANALERLKVFEGVPPPYDNQKRFVIPDALKIVRLKNHRPSCVLGDLLASVGWKQQSIVSKLEEKRKARGLAYYKRKASKVNAKRKAVGAKEVQAINSQLENYGY